MSADANGIRRNSIQEMFWTRTGLLLAVLLVISVGSLWISSAMDAGLFKNLVTALAFCDAADRGKQTGQDPHPSTLELWEPCAQR